MILTTVQYAKIKGTTRQAVGKMIREKGRLPNVFKIILRDRKYLLYTNLELKRLENIMEES